MLEDEVRKGDEQWHEVSVDAALDALRTKPEGLSWEEAETRLRSYGPNRLPEPAKRSALVRFVVHFHNILIYVLVGSALITAVLGHLIDTFVILAVVFANAVIGFVQEGKAQKAMDAIRKMLALKASVLRNGERKAITGEALVPGDIVLLEAGDKVPADLRLLRVSGLQVRNQS